MRGPVRGGNSGRPFNRIVRLHLETASKLLAVAMGLWALPVMADSAQPCPNLSGHYQLTGRWELTSMLDSPPRVDEWAFGFVARAVTGPSRAVVVHDVAAGNLSVDIIGTGVDLLWKDASPALPFSRRATCSDGRWVFERTVKGGGDNTPSKMKIRIALELGTDGRLMSQGSREVTVGYFMPSTTNANWVASFAKIGQ